jgi:hypothetical protein
VEKLFADARAALAVSSNTAIYLATTINTSADPTDEEMIRKSHYDGSAFWERVVEEQPHGVIIVKASRGA